VCGTVYIEPKRFSGFSQYKNFINGTELTQFAYRLDFRAFTLTCSDIELF